jgi:HPt (histidine-containing phosphotransfer) domain-containing protein
MAADGLCADDAPAAGMPPAVQAAFQRLRGQFLAGLPARWLEIESAAPGTAQRDALHRLAGAAGSYSFEALGQAARQAERRCEAGTPAPAAALAALQAELARLLVTVR